MTFDANLVPQFLFFALCTVVFAFLRPAMIRDYDGRRLPYNPQSRLIVVIIYLLIYSTLTVALELAGAAIRSVFSDIPHAGRFLNSVHLTAPFYSIALLGVLWQIPFIKEVDRAFLIALHSTRNARDNAILLSQHLMRCQFSPSNEERHHYENELNEHNVFLKDKAAEQIETIVVHNWRKVSTLIRLVQGWNETGYRVLNEEETLRFEEALTSHQRKTSLACHMINMFQKLGKEVDPSRIVAGLREIIGAGAKGTGEEAITARLKSILADAGNGAEFEPSAELSAEEFKNYVQQMGNYFQAEYRSLLQQVARLAAQCVVLSGSVRTERLDQLKSTGFAGIGHFNYMSFNRLLWVFFVTAFGGYIIMLYGSGSANAAALARFAVTIAIAGLIGAVVGSFRNLARASDPRWDIYFFAGLLSAALFIGFTVLQNIVIRGIPVTSLDVDTAAPHWNDVLPPRTIPFSLLSLAVTISVAYLARFKNWRGLTAWLGPKGDYFERAIDGLLVSAAVLVSYYAALALLPLLNLPLPPNIERQMSEWAQLPKVITIVLPYPIQWPLQIFAFVVGALFVRDVRTSAHATIVDLESTKGP
jgi:hypothetical protein